MDYEQFGLLPCEHFLVFDLPLIARTSCDCMRKASIAKTAVAMANAARTTVATAVISPDRSFGMAACYATPSSGTQRQYGASDRASTERVEVVGELDAAHADAAAVMQAGLRTCTTVRSAKMANLDDSHSLGGKRNVLAGAISPGRPATVTHVYRGLPTRQGRLSWPRRVGQHVFAPNVLSKCGQQCIFYGLNPSAFGARHKTNVFIA